MARRRKKKRTSNGIYYLILLVCIVCLAYEPVTKKLSEAGIKLPADIEAFVKEKAQLIAGEDDDMPAAERAELAEGGRATRPAAERVAAESDAEDMPAAEKGEAYAGKHLEIPAKLTDRSELILKRKGYTTSYNKDLKLPNWVAWELTPEKLVERESRTDKFLPDPDLPADEAVTTDDYKGCGMDRGHMCPAGDNRWHWRAMQESFYMTNICPQNHNLNRGDWKELEEACRRWAEEEGRIYIVCGPILYDQRHRTIGRQHKVTVPEAFFKVVLCMESNPPRAIGFIYKNTSGNHPLDSYVNTVDEVERITGIDFFPALPDKVEREVEAKYDLRLWTTPAPATSSKPARGARLP